MQVALQKFLRHARGLIDVAAPDAEKAIHDRRIVEDEEFFSRWRAVFLDHFKFSFRKARRELSRIRNRRRGTDELRVRPVKSRDAPQSSQYVGQVAAKHAAVRVQFVEDNVAQIFKQALPARVVRQNPRVQHVGIRKHNVAALADGLARIGGRIAVVGKHSKAMIETPG